MGQLSCFGTNFKCYKLLYFGTKEVTNKLEVIKGEVLVVWYGNRVWVHDSIHQGSNPDAHKYYTHERAFNMILAFNRNLMDQDV